MMPHYTPWLKELGLVSIIMLSNLTEAWILLRQPAPNSKIDFEEFQTPANGHATSRRNFWASLMLPVGACAILEDRVKYPANAASNDDPFAQLDAFSNTLGTSAQNAMPPSSVGDDKSKREEGGIMLKTTPERSSTNAAPPTSAMEKALEEARNRKRIDPRTHG
eukprot:CAMPEP_0176027946 /NCGR_PEP_ID=MMETSP0120_2-20121206/13709_1 /TAXON_ID=160619 /ORGANISM="Kryptoperidinium foliaceum, Strain CCMP 1326" /LENGTH=163 /DNA_ID=CAMNT_0017361151 /DNA_START=105 /DNA_END=596 /DNA_ORIENTATION=-